MEEMEKLCCTCKWWFGCEEHNSVCSNHNSERIADFTEPDDWCEKWEEHK